MQQAVFAVQVALAATMEQTAQCGRARSSGHSMGESAPAVIAKVLSLSKDAARRLPPLEADDPRSGAGGLGGIARQASEFPERWHRGDRLIFVVPVVASAIHGDRR